MDTGISTATTKVLVPDPSPMTAFEQLKELYSLEIARLLEDISKLLPRYSTVVASEIYERDRAKVMLVAAYVSEGTMSIRALATVLNYLLTQQKLFTDSLQQGVSTHLEQNDFRLQCQDTGVVKAYMKMTQHKAANRNLQLAGDLSCCRWILIPTIRRETILEE